MMMAHVDTTCIAAYRQISGSSQLALSKGWWPPSTVLHSSDEPGKLSQWLCHDDSAINISLGIIMQWYMNLDT